jgi:hypothetical protein
LEVSVDAHQMLVAPFTFGIVKTSIRALGNLIS